MDKKLILKQNIERKEKALVGYKRNPKIFDKEFIENREQELKVMKERYEKW